MNDASKVIFIKDDHEKLSPDYKDHRLSGQDLPVVLGDHRTKHAPPILSSNFREMLDHQSTNPPRLILVVLMVFMIQVLIATSLKIIQVFAAFALPVLYQIMYYIGIGLLAVGLIGFLSLVFQIFFCKHSENNNTQG